MEISSFVFLPFDLAKEQHTWDWKISYLHLQSVDMDVVMVTTQLSLYIYVILPLRWSETRCVSFIYSMIFPWVNCCRCFLMVQTIYVSVLDSSWASGINFTWTYACKGRMSKFPGLKPFTSGDQSTGASASASFLPMSILAWFPLRLTGLISLLSKGLSGVFSSTTVQRYRFFGTLPSSLPPFKIQLRKYTF